VSNDKPQITDNALAFNTLPLSAEQLSNLERLGFSQMSDIQAKSLPAIIEGKDVIAKAKTGSGKTLAFGLGLLHKLNVKHWKIQALVICPTRELADQVASELRKLAKATHNIKILTLCGASPIGPQIGSLEHGAHIVVGTPGRLQDHLRKQTLDLSHIETVVLDEADRMLDMGFIDEMQTILSHTPASRQTLLFSATYNVDGKDDAQSSRGGKGKNKSLKQIADKFLQQPLFIEAKVEETSNQIEQCFIHAENKSGRFKTLKYLLESIQPESAIIFCHTKRDTQNLCDQLCQHGFSAAALHGDLEQRDRNKTLVQFANKSVRLLIATDVAARGLDIDAVSLVINYQLPQDAAVYTHRIGRTGRAGLDGLAYSLFDEQDDFKCRLIFEAFALNEQDTIIKRVPEQHCSKGDKDLGPIMQTIEIAGGKKQKLRKGDILGALTNKKNPKAIAGSEVGRIDVSDNKAFVAVSRGQAKAALNILSEGKIKGRNFRARIVR